MYHKKNFAEQLCSTSAVHLEWTKDKSAQQNEPFPFLTSKKERVHLLESMIMLREFNSSLHPRGKARRSSIVNLTPIWLEIIKIPYIPKDNASNCVWMQVLA